MVLLLCGAPLLAYGEQVYRWVDSAGVVHFSQNPPASGDYKDVTNSLPPSTTYSSPGSPARPAVQGGSGSGSSQTLQAKADNAERCAKARERISFLEEKTAHRLMVTGPDGQPARMTSDQFNSEVDDAKAAAAKYCD
jgi:hypothetical protein